MSFVDDQGAQVTCLRGAAERVTKAAASRLRRGETKALRAVARSARR